MNNKEVAYSMANVAARNVAALYSAQRRAGVLESNAALDGRNFAQDARWWAVNAAEFGAANCLCVSIRAWCATFGTTWDKAVRQISRTIDLMQDEGREFDFVRLGFDRIRPQAALENALNIFKAEEARLAEIRKAAIKRG